LKIGPLDLYSQVIAHAAGFRVYYLVFTALHTMQCGIVSERTVRPSSVKRVDCDKTKKNVCPHYYTVWKIAHRSFPTRRMVGGRLSLLPEMLSQTDPILSKTPIFNQFLVALIPPEGDCKTQNTLFSYTFFSKKVCYKVSLSQNRSRQS